MTKTQKREKEQTEAFLKYANIEYIDLKSLPEGFDPPDIIITTPDNRRIAIEHTMLPKPQGEKIKPIYDTYDSVIEDAKIKFEKAFDFPIIVHFEFAAKLDTRKGKKAKLVDEIFTLIAENLPEMNSLSYITTNVIDQDLLPKYLKSLKIIWSKNTEENRWGIMNLAWSSELLLEQLNSKVNEKNQILIKKQYNLEYDETWMLMITEGNHWSEFSRYRPKDFVVSPLWQFDRIYIFGMFEFKTEILK